MASYYTVEFGSGPIGIVTKTLKTSVSTSLVVVAKVNSGSQAEQKGVGENDVIVSIGSRNVQTHEEAAEEIGRQSRPIRILCQRMSGSTPSDHTHWKEIRVDDTASRDSTHDVHLDLGLGNMSMRC
jgi:C-terminal processing protease CtpA/Prc